MVDAPFLSHNNPFQFFLQPLKFFVAVIHNEIHSSHSDAMAWTETTPYRNQYDPESATDGRV
jgi:hypothetical protein